MPSLLDVVRRSLQQRQAVDARERRSIETCLQELRRLPEPFDQHADPVHVTGSAVVVSPAGMLLLKHKRLGIWVQPGGHLEPAETPWSAAWREAAEETGLALPTPAPELLHVDVHAGGRGHTHLDLRYLIIVAEASEPAPPEGESQEVRWFAWDEAAAVADPGLAGLVATLSPP
jgi:8-oxo-dGTP pyrophosphatase MutT (NUDIX family)